MRTNPKPSNTVIGTPPDFPQRPWSRSINPHGTTTGVPAAVAATAFVFCDAAEYLSRRFAKHFYDVVLRNILRRMFEENEMAFVACDDGPLG